MRVVMKSLVGLLCIAAIGGAGYYYVILKEKPAATDLYTTKNVRLRELKKFYTPSYIPDGYTIKQEAVASPESTEDVVIVQLVSKSQPRIFISQQPLPEGFTEEKFLSNMKNRSAFETDAGAAYIGTIDDGATIMASITNEKLWIIINSEKSVPQDTLIKIAKGLKL